MTLNAKFVALSDPTRRAILAQLANGQATVSELAEPHQLAQPTISKHLKVLEMAGLIETRVEAQSRPRRLLPEGLMMIDEWLEPYRARWERRLDNLEDFLDQKRNAEKKN